MAMSADFELVRAGVALAMLTSASYFDLKKREVSDLLWLVFAVAAGIIYVFDFPSSLYEGIAIVISISITAGVAYGVYRAGLFGGADMLALITLSVIMPLHGGTPLWETRTFHYIAPMIVFTNAIIFSVAQVGVNIIRNAAYNSRRPGKLFEGLEREPMSRKVIAMIIGHRSDNPQFDFPIEKTVGGRRKFDFAFKNAETADYEERKDVWVMSGIPFLVYFTIGFLFMIVVGDVFAIIFHLPI